MRNKKVSMFINVFFILLGLTLVFLKLNAGLESFRDWFSLVVGGLVAIISFIQLTQINKSSYTNKREL